MFRIQRFASRLWQLIIRSGLFYKLFLKKKQHNHPEGNGGVGNIKNRTEEFKFIPSHKRKPVRIMRFDQRAIPPLHHAAMQEPGLTMGGKQPGYMIVSAFFKNKSVEHAVDQVAQRAGKN